MRKLCVAPVFRFVNVVLFFSCQLSLFLSARGDLLSEGHWILSVVLLMKAKRGIAPSLRAESHI